MCMIVDTNRLGDFLAKPETPDAAPIHQWLRRGWGKLVFSVGGAFATELYPAAKDRLLEYDRGGRAKRFADEEVEDEARRLESAGVVRSNDAHVLALARVSRARLLYSGDVALIADFKDRKIIREPRGKIYSGAKNEGLLTRDACVLE